MPPKHINDLPNELLPRILHYLNPYDLLEASLVCRAWYAAVRSPIFYRTLTIGGNVDFNRPPLSIFRSTRFIYSKYHFKACKDLCEGDPSWNYLGHVVTEVTLERCSELTNDTLFQFLQHFPNLKVLRIIGSNALTVATVPKLALRLAELEIKRNEMSKDVIQTVLNGFEAVQQLKIHVDVLLVDDDYTFEQAIDDLEALSESVAAIRVSHSDSLIEENDLEKFLTVEKLRTEYYYHYGGRISLEKFKQFCEKQTDIGTMVLTGSFENDVGVEYLKTINKHLKNLRKLKISLQTAPDKALEHLSDLKKLQFFKVDNFRSNSTFTTKTLCLPGIQEIAFPINDTILNLEETLASVPNLARLELFDFPVDDTTAQIIFKHCRLLRSLTLIRCENVTDAGFIGGDSSLADLRGLRILNLGKCGKITDATFEKCFSFLDLKWIRIEGLTDVTKVGVEAFAKGCPSIERLVISHAEKTVDFEELKAITAKHLKRCIDNRVEPFYQLDNPIGDPMDEITAIDF